MRVPRVATEIVWLISRVCAYRISFRFRHDSTVPRNKVNVVIDRKRRADFTLFFFFVIILHYYSVFLFFLLHSPLRLSRAVSSRFRIRSIVLFYILCRLLCRIAIPYWHAMPAYYLPSRPAATPFAALPSVLSTDLCYCAIQLVVQQPQPFNGVKVVFIYLYSLCILFLSCEPKNDVFLLLL